MEVHYPRSSKNAVKIPVGNIELDGDLIIPENPLNLVIFSHGSGSSRLSPRNNMVAEVLQKRGIATLLFDLLTTEEDADYEKRFEIDLLTKRLRAATGWVLELIIRKSVV